MEEWQHSELCFLLLLFSAPSLGFNPAAFLTLHTGTGRSPPAAMGWVLLPRALQLQFLCCVSLILSARFGHGQEVSESCWLRSMCGSAANFTKELGSNSVYIWGEEATNCFARP